MTKFIFLVAAYTVLLGCEKLGIYNNCCKVVLEEDGADIDDDETLEAYNDRTLMILQPDEDWLSASEQNKQPAKMADEGN